VIRKGQEAIATTMMERMWTKQRILEVYMNSVEFGDHIYG
jgi:monofunctional biosynthetic peptidoglycan transglycosylase